MAETVLMHAGAAFTNGSLTRRCAMMAEIMRSARRPAAGAVSGVMNSPGRSSTARVSFNAPTALRTQSGRP